MLDDTLAENTFGQETAAVREGRRPTASGHIPIYLNYGTEVVSLADVLAAVRHHRRGERDGQSRTSSLMTESDENSQLLMTMHATEFGMKLRIGTDAARTATIVHLPMPPAASRLPAIGKS